MSKKSDRETIINAGRAVLKAWLIAAEKHGTIYYEITNVARSGMSRRIVLQTIRMVKGKPVLDNLFPGLPETDFGGDWKKRSDAVDMVAKDWGFSFKHRAFVVGGCGMDMVFALVDDLASKAGIKAIPNKDKRMDRIRPSGESYANRVRRESFS
jgi:hypothetical protein